MNIYDEVHVVHGKAAIAEYQGLVELLNAYCSDCDNKRGIQRTVDDWNLNFGVDPMGAAHHKVVELSVSHLQDGRIVRTTSPEIEDGARFATDNSTTKFAVIDANRALAYECTRDDVRTNFLCPNFARGRVRDRKAERQARHRSTTPSEVVQNYIDQTPLGSPEAIEGIADVISFLASTSERLVTRLGTNSTHGVYATSAPPNLD